MADLFSVVIGGGIALAGSFGAKIWEEWRQRAALSAAFSAEINGLLQIAAHRKHRHFFENAVAGWKRGEDFELRFFFGTDDFPKDPVYEKNVDKIGMLGSNAADVVLFYTQLRGIRVHMVTIARGGLKDFALPQRVDFAEQALALWAETEPLGKSLIERLRPQQRSWWRR